MSISQRVSNIKISRKLSVGFGVVLFLVAFATILSVLRFKEIRDVYEKTNLMYNINIEVFQAKINRLKYFYGDDKSGQVMANYVRHASELTASADALSWSSNERKIIDDVARNLANFQASIGEMQKATGDLRALRESLDKLSTEDLSARYTTLVRTPVADPAVMAQIYEQLFAISSVRDAALVVRYSPDAATRDRLEQQFAATASHVQALNSQLPGELQAPLQAIWDNTVSYRSHALNYFTAWQALKAAEDKVKVGGDASSASLRDIIALVKAHNEELAYTSSSITAVTGAIAILLGMLVSWWVIRQITRPVHRNLALAERIASGDLSSQIRAQSRDELGQLTGAMGRMNDRLRDMIHEVRNSVTQLSRAATEIADGNTDLSSRTEQQAAAVVQTAASMEQLTATVKNNADNARNASSLAAQASKTASEGGTVMRQVVDTMGDINTSSNKIADITAVINSIAFQTNILALNAAVEAARAGEQGKGFAVVAGEVRHLASRSASAANDIRKLIDASASKVQSGSEQVHAAGRTMDDIVEQVKNVTQLIAQISHATSEQATGLSELTRAVAELDSITQKNADLVEESAHISAMVKHRAGRLKDAVTVLH